MILDGDLCGICPHQEPHFKLLEAVETFFQDDILGTEHACMYRTGYSDISIACPNQ